MTRDISAPGQAAQNGYLDRLYQLIPAEITGAYLAISNILDLEKGLDGDVTYLVSISMTYLILQILVPIYVYKIQNVRNAGQIIASTLSFPIWAANISSAYIGSLTTLDIGMIAGVVLILWTLMVPLLAQGETA